MEVYDPGAIVLQCGADSLAKDRLGSWALSIRGAPRSEIACLCKSTVAIDLQRCKCWTEQVCAHDWHVNLRTQWQLHPILYCDLRAQVQIEQHTMAVCHAQGTAMP